MILLYHCKKDVVKARYVADNIWISMKHISIIYGKPVPTVCNRIEKIYELRNVKRDGTCRYIREIHDTESGSCVKNTKYYNIELLKIVNFFFPSNHMNAFMELAKNFLDSFNGKKTNKFLAEVEQIRDTEKTKLYEVKNMFSESADYMPNTQESRDFFRKMQNLFYYAATGKTGCEIIIERIDHFSKDLGMANVSIKSIQKKDAKIAKNYLYKSELKKLTSLLSDFVNYINDAEHYWKIRNMQDWIDDLSIFLNLKDLKVLKQDKISFKKRESIIEDEYDRFKQGEREKKKIIKSIKKTIKGHLLK